MNYPPIFLHKILIHRNRIHNLYLHKIQYEDPSIPHENRKYLQHNPSKPVSINTHIGEDEPTHPGPRSIRRLHMPNTREPIGIRLWGKGVEHRQAKPEEEYLLKY